MFYLTLQVTPKLPKMDLVMVFAANPSSIYQVCLPCQCVIKQKTDSEILYHVIASKEGVYSIQVVVEQLGHTVDDIEGDRLQNVHHLHVLSCVEIMQKTNSYQFFLSKCQSTMNESVLL